MKIMDLIYGTEGISSCPPESVCPLCFLGAQLKHVSWPSCCCIGLQGEGFSPGIWEVMWTVAPHVLLHALPPSHLLAGGAWATLGARIENEGAGGTLCSKSRAEKHRVDYYMKKKHVHKVPDIREFIVIKPLWCLQWDSSILHPT